MNHSRPSINTRHLFILGAPNDDNGRLSEISLARIETVVRLFDDDSRIIVIPTGGYGAHFNRTTRPHHAYVARELEARGVSVAPVENESFLSANTVEDVIHIAEYVGKIRLHNFEVVTSAFHIARTKMIFRCVLPDSQVSFHASENPENASAVVEHERKALAKIEQQGGIIIDQQLFSIPR